MFPFDKWELIGLMVPAVLMSLTVHEYSHGRMAFLLGDNTAKLQGRLSFNPLKHLHPVGTLLIFFFGLGFAKPVPVDPRNFENPRRDMMYVAIAGPLSNLALAVIFSFFIRVIDFSDNLSLFILISFGLYINVMLAIFNLLPVFPLDGSSVIKGLVPASVAARLGDMDRIGVFFLLGAILLDRFAHTNIFGFILEEPIKIFLQILTVEKEVFDTLNLLLSLTFSIIFNN